MQKRKSEGSKGSLINLFAKKGLGQHTPNLLVTTLKNQSNLQLRNRGCEFKICWSCRGQGHYYFQCPYKNVNTQLQVPQNKGQTN